MIINSQIKEYNATLLKFLFKIMLFILLWCMLRESPKVVHDIWRSYSVSRLQQSSLECTHGLPASVMPWLPVVSGCGTFLGMTNKGILIGPKQAEPLIPKGRTLRFQLHDKLPGHASHQYFDIPVQPFMLCCRELFIGVLFNLNWTECYL